MQSRQSTLKVSIALAAGVSATFPFFNYSIGGSLNSLSGWGVCDSGKIFLLSNQPCLNSLSGWGVCDNFLFCRKNKLLVSIALAAGVSATNCLDDSINCCCVSIALAAGVSATIAILAWVGMPIIVSIALAAGVSATARDILPLTTGTCPTFWRNQRLVKEHAEILPLRRRKIKAKSLFFQGWRNGDESLARKPAWHKALRRLQASCCVLPGVSPHRRHYRIMALGYTAMRRPSRSVDLRRKLRHRK